MRRTAAIVAFIVLCTGGPVCAMSFGGPGGTWPKSWPKELEPLRKQAWTWVGQGLLMSPTRYEIPFANRQQFESVWPHILKVKSKGAPLTLLRGPHAWVHVGPVDAAAGVRIVVEGTWSPQAQIPPGTPVSIELVVDGAIVDLNRIPLPADTPIIDQRFKGKP